MIGDKIRERRLELGMTQLQLSQLTDIKKNTISNYENNVSSPSEDNIFKLMEALKCDANYLFEWEEAEELKLSLEEKKHIKKYRSVDTYGKEAVNKVLDVEYRRCESQKMVDVCNHSDTVTIAEVARTDDNRKSLNKKQASAEELKIFDIAPQSDEEL